MLPIASGLSRYCPVEPHDEVELLLLLDHLGRDVAADGGLDQAVDVVDVDAVARDLGAIDLDREARLAELLHQGDVADAAHVLEHVLDRLALLLERVEVRPEHLHRERALQAGLGLVDRVLGRLGVVEGDAGEGCELVVDRLDQLRLGADRRRATANRASGRRRIRR